MVLILVCGLALRLNRKMLFINLAGLFLMLFSILEIVLILHYKKFYIWGVQSIEGSRQALGIILMVALFVIFFMISVYLMSLR